MEEFRPVRLGWVSLAMTPFTGSGTAWTGNSRPIRRQTTKLILAEILLILLQCYSLWFSNEDRMIYMIISRELS